MKKLLLILLCLPMIGFGQNWEKTFGGILGDVGRSVQQTLDGGYIITGATDITDGGIDESNAYLLKTDSSGNLIWSQTFSNYFEGHSVKQTSDGGYIIVGISDILYEFYLLKTDGNGNQIWSQTFSGYGMSVQQTTDGGYIVTGWNYTNVGVGIDIDVYLLKTDASGNEIWSQTFGGTDVDRGRSVKQTIDGGYVILGETNFGSNCEVYIIKTDSTGIIQWDNTFNSGVLRTWGTSVFQTGDGGYIISASRDDSFNFEQGYLIKIDSNGIEQWNKTYSGGCVSVQQTTDGGYIFTGDTVIGSLFGASDLYLAKTDVNGNIEWDQSFGGPGENTGASVQQTTDGGYIVTGAYSNSPNTSTSTNTSTDVYLIKTDGNGNITSTFNIPINPNRKLQKTVDLLGRVTKGKKNQPLFYIYDDGTVEKRIVIE